MNTSFHIVIHAVCFVTGLIIGIIINNNLYRKNRRNILCNDENCRPGIMNGCLAGVILGIVCFKIPDLMGISKDFIVLLICVICIYTIALTDIYEMTIPNTILLIIAIVWAVDYADFCNGILNFKPMFTRILAALFIGIALLTVVRLADLAFRKNTFGGGDIKLVIVCTLYLGLYDSLLMLFIACIMCLVFQIVKKVICFISSTTPQNNIKNVFPFGPYICMSFVLQLFCCK